MSQHALRTVLQLADAPSSAALTYEDVMQWPEEARVALLGAGWLRDGGLVQEFTCRECDQECTEEVHWSGENAFITCPGGQGRIAVKPELLRYWVIDPSGVAAWLCGMLATRQEPQEVVRGRLWSLGRPPVHGQPVSVYLGRGASWRDAGAVYAGVGELQGEGVRVVLVPGRVPRPDLLGQGTRVLTLQQAVEFGGDGLRLNLLPIERLVPRSKARVMEDLAPIRTAAGVTWGQVMIEFLDDERVRVSVVGHREERSFAAMGFQDRRKAGEQPDVLWGLLLLLAREQGRLGSEDSGRAIAAASFGKVKKWIGDIRKRLRALFPNIAGDPFKPYRKVKAYETEFVLRWAGG